MTDGHGIIWLGDIRFDRFQAINSDDQIKKLLGSVMSILITTLSWLSFVQIKAPQKTNTQLLDISNFGLRMIFFPHLFIEFRVTLQNSI